MINRTYPSMEECGGYLHTHPPGTSYLWKFQGIPFNLFLNISAAATCVLLGIAMNFVTCVLRKKEVPVFAFLRNTEKGWPKLTIRRFFFMEDWEFAQRAGMDGVAYLRVLVYNMYQLISMLPFVVIALPIYYRGGEATSPFARLSITNLSLNNIEGPWVLWTLALICSVAYLVCIVLRYKYAYQWPEASGICRMWNSESHGAVDASKSLSPFAQDDRPIDSSLDVVPTTQVHCECNLVNQLPNVLMLSDIPKKPLGEIRKDLLSYFASFNPPVSVRWIQPVRDVRLVTKHERMKLVTEEYERIAKAEYDRTGHEPVYTCGLCQCGNGPCLRGLCCCCCCCPCVQAAQSRSCWSREVYRDRISAYNVYLEAQYKRMDSLSPAMVDQKMTGVMFVGVDSADEALRVATEFSIYLQRTIPTDYRLHVDVNTTCLTIARWAKMLINPNRARYYASAPFGHLQLAPLPAEILWSNLMSSRYRSSWWWIIQMLKSIGIFLVALLLTSPTYLLLMFNLAHTSDWLKVPYGFIVYQWVPALILVSAGGLVKQLIIVSEAWTKHATYGGQEKVGQRTLFLFLVISVLIFPSLGVAGLPILIERLSGQRGDGEPLRLECIFLPDSAALFVNYVITSALLGNALTLLQLSRWLWFLIYRVFTVHSTAEARFLAEENAGPFPFRERYASMNLIQTIVIAYTPISPIILFFGLLYFFCDYIICRYALLKIYTPYWFDDGHKFQPKSQFEGADRIYHMTWVIHSNNLSMFGICLACLNLCFFFSLRLGVVYTRPVTVAFLLLTLLLIVACILFAVILNGQRIRFGSKCASDLRTRTCPSRKPSEHESTSKGVDPPAGPEVSHMSAVNGAITFAESSYTATYFRQSKFASK